MTRGDGGPRAGLLLAAGISQRFGPANKLTAVYRGKPLIQHAVARLRECGFEHLWVVLRDPDLMPLLPGFTPVLLRDDAPALSESLRQGIAAVQENGAQGALVALADMPLITSGHLQALYHAGAAHGLSASSRDGQLMPPAWFDAQYFDQLQGLQGDQGASKLLQTTLPAARIACPARELTDIDHPQDLQ
ncbi:MAG: nucleotidyltransferase family protein [Mangrovicoccus sp.]|nr:nucleotidyltransferase family protein [Mangrovicoccus sp.]